MIGDTLLIDARRRRLRLVRRQHGRRAQRVHDRGRSAACSWRRRKRGVRVLRPGQRRRARTQPRPGLRSQPGRALPGDARRARSGHALRLHCVRCQRGLAGCSFSRPPRRCRPFGFDGALGGQVSGLAVPIVDWQGSAAGGWGMQLLALRRPGAAARRRRAEPCGIRHETAQSHGFRRPRAGADQERQGRPVTLSHCRWGRLLSVGNCRHGARGAPCCGPVFSTNKGSGQHHGNQGT